MTGEWKRTTLGSIADKAGYGLVDGPFGSNLPAASYTDEGIPVIRGSNLSLGTTRFRSEGFVFVSRETASQHERSLCRPDDIVFTKKGTIGQTGIVPRDGQHSLYLLSSNQMKLSVDRSIADPLFVYYVVSAPSNVAKIIRDSEATGVPKINVAYLREFPITLPSLAEQRSISALLGPLDDRIDLNRRMNATLEAMARAIFRDWFVDFGPVRAKASGYEPYLSPEIWSLFPDHLSDDGKPKGWGLEQVGNVLELAYGKALTARDRRDGQFPVYGSGGIAGYHAEAMIPGPAIIVGRKGTVGSLFWEDRACFPIDTVFFVKSRRSLAYCYYLLQTLGLEGMNTDAAVPGLNRSNVYRLPIARPPEELLSKFDDITTALRNKMRGNTEQSETLSSIRDLLIPKLISGEIRIRDAQEMVAEVA